MGTPTGGHQCYLRLLSDDCYFLSRSPGAAGCNTPLPPLFLGQAAMYAVSPKFLNVDIKIYVNVLEGGEFHPLFMKCFSMVPVLCMYYFSKLLAKVIIMRLCNASIIAVWKYDWLTPMNLTNNLLCYILEVDIYISKSEDFFLVEWNSETQQHEVTTSSRIFPHPV